MWACLFYIAANVAGLILFWLFQESRRNSPSSEEETRYGVDDFVVRQPLRIPSRTSLWDFLGASSTPEPSGTFFAFEDHFQTFEEVTLACRRAGLEKCSLIIGVDFSASNEWQGRKTFGGHCLHRIIQGKIYNPYQKVISIIGKTLEPFDDDNLIPAFGFGDSSTRADDIFPFKFDGEPCQGFAEVLERYSEIATKVKLSGPTCFAPLILHAVEIVKASKEFHILFIIADGQVTEQQKTVEAIVEASHYPLSIVVVGVGDGPWHVMQEFDNCLPQRCFDNFQFVNYHAVMSKSRHPEASFALHALMEVPDQYKTVKTLGYLSQKGSRENLI